jgi:hypothetical protein
VIVFTRERADGKLGGDPDPLAPVTMTHAKATLSRPAGKIVWRPVETPSGGVYLRPLSDDEALRANAAKLRAAVPPEGLTRTDFHKRPPAGLSRKDAEAARDLLIELGHIEETERTRGATNQKARVYVLTEGER